MHIQTDLFYYFYYFSYFYVHVLILHYFLDFSLLLFLLLCPSPHLTLPYLMYEGHY